MKVKIEKCIPTWAPIDLVITVETKEDMATLAHLVTCWKSPETCNKSAKVMAALGQLEEAVEQSIPKPLKEYYHE